MPAPRVIHEPTIEPTPEYTEFLTKLAAYHEKRGTHFDPEPRVGARGVDLLLLFNAVISKGGYDKVSDEKKAWRNLGQEFNLGSHNLPALGFALKTAYYKNLAAYEISTIHNKEPPPKEILEDLTAKGSGILTRTVENFRPAARRDTGNENSDGSGDEGTPVRDEVASEEIPGSGGRATRGLRQAPPQRVLFQPETQSSRFRGHTSNPSQSSPQSQQVQQPQQPQLRGASSSYNPTNSMESHSAAVANYEPRPQMPLTLRPVITPGNNAAEFKRRALQAKLQREAANGHVQPMKGVMFPGTGFDGPNIYVRCLCALRSGVPDEQRYALFHLVKISMERGDKYKFESFPGLAEALIEKALEASTLFYDVTWHISYYEDASISGDSTLNGIEGSPDIIRRLHDLKQSRVDNNVQSAEFSDALSQINEAALAIRNMVMLEENAQYISELSLLRDFLVIVLNLPSLDCVIELKHYALEISEQVTKYLHLHRTDPLYVSLLDQLVTEDRGAILTALRAISRISMNLEESNNLRGVPKQALQNIFDWILLPDEELAHACLDFLYQYTAVVENVEYILRTLDPEPLVNQLTRLLAYGAKVVDREITFEQDTRKSAPQDIVELPQELLKEIVLMPEPDRSSNWLRCLFEEDATEAITQIALWQGYQNQFSPLVPPNGPPMLVAAEFIKNVSTTFAEKATAQVQTGPTTRFIIRGIRRRATPVDLNGEEFRKCCWVEPSGSTSCNRFFVSPRAMYDHILREHIGAVRTESGKFENISQGRHTCLWRGCHRFGSTNPPKDLAEVASHLKVHLPPAVSVVKPSNDSSNIKRQRPSYIIPGAKKHWQIQSVPADERQEASGLPLTSALVLRNLARNIPKTDADENFVKSGGSSRVFHLFKPVEPRFWEILAHNKPLSIFMTDLLHAIKEV